MVQFLITVIAMVVGLVVRYGRPERKRDLGDFDRLRPTVEPTPALDRPTAERESAPIHDSNPQTPMIDPNEEPYRPMFIRADAPVRVVPKPKPKRRPTSFDGGTAVILIALCAALPIILLIAAM